MKIALVVFELYPKKTFWDRFGQIKKTGPWFLNLNILYFFYYSDIAF